MTEAQRIEYLRLLALACSSWANPPKWWQKECTREQAEMIWLDFLKSVVPANNYLKEVA
jgi:hypothetical protein